MPVTVIKQPDTYATQERLAPRDKVTTGTASDPIVYASTTPYWIDQGKSTRTVTWATS